MVTKKNVGKYGGRQVDAYTISEGDTEVEVWDLGARINAIDKVMIGLDYFDASINRLSAWVTGQRAMQKALLYALLIPHEKLRSLQDSAAFTELMVAQEEVKDMPFGAVWKEYLSREGLKEDYLTEIKKYESEVLNKR